MHLALSLTTPHGVRAIAAAIGAAPLCVLATLGVGRAIAHAITRHRAPTAPAPTDREGERDH